MGTVLLGILIFYCALGVSLTMRNNDKDKAPLSKRTKQLFLIPTFIVLGIAIWHLTAVYRVLHAGVWSLDSRMVTSGFGLFYIMGLFSYGVFKKNSLRWLVNLAHR